MDIELEILKLNKRLEKLEELLNVKYNEPKTTENKKNRDKTRYLFESKIYPKNRLVLAVVKKYVEDNKPTLTQLQNVFDRSLQGSLNVVETMENAIKITDSAKRYFTNEPIALADNAVVVICTQWGIFNINNFIKQATRLGYIIESL